MTADTVTIKPEFSKDQADELGHLEYFLAKLAGLRDRGLISSDAFDIAASECESRREIISRAGQFEACMAKARGFTASSPKQAVHWAERAIEVDRDRALAWRLIVGLCWNQQDDQAAIEWCAQGADTFPSWKASSTACEPKPARGSSGGWTRRGKRTMKKSSPSAYKQPERPSTNAGLLSRANSAK